MLPYYAQEVIVHMAINISILLNTTNIFIYYKIVIVDHYNHNHNTCLHVFTFIQIQECYLISIR